MTHSAWIAICGETRCCIRMQAQAALSGQLVVARQQHAEVCLQLQKDHAALQQAALQEHALQKVISHLHTRKKALGRASTRCCTYTQCSTGSLYSRCSVVSGGLLIHKSAVCLLLVLHAPVQVLTTDTTAKGEISDVIADTPPVCVLPLIIQYRR